MIGKRLGHYEIVSALGKGGMGEVWRARDTKLGREVAIKTLPEEFARDADRLARFQREATLLASLNHPNIAAIHGLEEHDSTRFLVLELVDGPTLADRIQQGPIPVEESLRIAFQIAEALEAAHEKGVIHRDLKPANIKITADDKVKVLDFGLAKAAAPAADSPSGSQFPTISTPAMTQAGIILGTAAYMSPEQARGKPVDRRADIWAFGCVLYEMLTGRRAFEGEDVTETLAGVVKSEPEWQRLPASLSATRRAYLMRCLEKDPKQRARDVGDVRLGLEGGFEGAPMPSGAVAAGGGWRRIMPWVMGAMAGLAIAVAGSLLQTGSNMETAINGVRRATLVLTSDGLPIRRGLSGFAVDPGGRFMVFGGAAENGIVQLYLRQLADRDASPIPGTEGGADSLAVSPDGRWVAFVSGRRLKRVAVAGGNPVDIHTFDANPNGVAWLGNDRIVFGAPDGLRTIGIDGGAAEPLTSVDRGAGEIDHRWPHVTPDGTILAYVAWFGSNEGSQIRLRALVNENEQTISGVGPRVTTSGHLLFARQSGVWGVAFDRESLEFLSDAVPVVDEVGSMLGGYVQYDVTADGTLIYESRSERSEPPVVMDNAGRVVRRLGESFRGLHHGPPRFSPAGTAVAVTRHPLGGEDQIVVHDMAINNMLSVGGAMSRFPVWGPGPGELTFGSDRYGSWDIFIVNVRTGGEWEELLIREGDQTPGSWSPDGETLAYVDGLSGSNGIWLLPRGGEPTIFLGSPTANEWMPRFSLDGRFLAYVSDGGSGRPEVYVRELPDGPPIGISVGGGTAPAWTTDRIYYESLNSGEVFAVDFQADPEFVPVSPPTRVLNEVSSGYVFEGSFDVVADGQSFVVMDSFIDSESLSIVVHWFEELNALVPRP